MNLLYRFEYFAGSKGWYVRLRHIDNGEILMLSESYTRKWNAKRAAMKMAKAFGVGAIEVP